MDAQRVAQIQEIAKSNNEEVKTSPGGNRITGIVRKNVDAETAHQERAVIASTSVGLALNSSVNATLPAGLTPATDAVPLDWPEELAWRPRRFFGPFWSGSNLSEIQVTISGELGGQWFYNDFFLDHPDADAYDPFYPGNNLPNQASPQQINFAPGDFPPADGASYMKFALDRIRYTSRYGGTVELLFRAKDDVGFEVRKDNIIWDLDNLEMKLYVAPTKEGLTTPAQAFSRGRINCEFVYDGATAYTVPTQGSFTNPAMPMQALDDDHIAELEMALAIIGLGVANSVAVDSRRFVSGFLRAQFPEFIGPGQIVDGINISDYFCEIFSHEGVPVVSVAFRARDVCGFGGDLFTEDEYRVFLESRYVRMANGSAHIETGGHREFELDNHEDTGWVVAGHWTLDEIDQIGDIVEQISGVEMDWPDSDDRFTTFENTITLDRAALRNAHQHGEYGCLESQIVHAAQQFEESSWHVFFDVTTNVNLMLR